MAYREIGATISVNFARKDPALALNERSCFSKSKYRRVINLYCIYYCKCIWNRRCVAFWVEPYYVWNIFIGRNYFVTFSADPSFGGIARLPIDLSERWSGHFY